MNATPRSPTEGDPGDDRPAATILVVEDEVEVGKVVRLTLELQGYHVISAQDAEAALRLATGHPDQIDLLIADVVMPRMSGAKLFDQLRQSRPTLRVLFISGYSDDILADYGLSSQDQRFLAKPFSSPTLGRRVRELLGRSVD